MDTEKAGHKGMSKMSFHQVGQVKPSEAIQLFRERVECAFSSKATRDNYCSAVKSFLYYAQGKTEKNISAIVCRYITTELQGMADKTVNLQRAAIVKYFSLVHKIKITIDDVPRRKEHRQSPIIIDQEKINEAISKTFNIKHRLELSLMYGCGLRLSELIYLKRKNIITTSLPWRLYLVHTKGNRYRYVPIPETCRQLLSDFISCLENDDYIFKGEKGIGHISERSVYNVVVAAFGRVGIVAHPHLLRHGYITHQIMSGQNVFKVQQWVGHGSLKSTLPYVHLSEKILSESTDLLAKGNYKNVSGI